MEGIFPEVDPGTFDDIVRVLCYSVHGGSGFSFTRRDVMEMGWGEALDHCEWLDEQRRREAHALRRASKSK